MDVCLINNHMPHFSFMSHIYCYTTAGIAWLPQQHKKMLEQTCITGTDNEVCNFYHSSRSWKYQDFFIKTKTKTIFHVLEEPRDQDQGLEITSLVTARHSSSGRQPNFTALNRGRHLYSAGRPSRWALAHILVIIIRPHLVLWCSLKLWNTKIRR